MTAQTITPATTNGDKETKAAVAVSKTPQPVEAMHSMRTAMNKLFDDFTLGMNWPAMFEKSSAQYMPRVNVAETEKAVIVTAELPGINIKDIDIKLLGDNLFVRGEKTEEKEENTVGYHRVERTYGSFERVLPVPPNVKRDAIDATYKDGVLKVTLPKTEEAVKSSRKIEVKGQ